MWIVFGVIAAKMLMLLMAMTPFSGVIVESISIGGTYASKKNISYIVARAL